MGRGCRGQPIFALEADRQHFAYLLTDVAERFDWKVYNWVLMPNHHHLVVRLEQPNLAEGMHRLHFMFGQRWNERAPSKGHVFFRRFKNIPLLRELASARVMRYIDLNPVRAGLCRNPAEWTWGGHNAVVGTARPWAFHRPELALRAAVPTVDDPEEARALYVESVHDRLTATRGRGTPHDLRPSLEELLVPGQVDSIREARETWWYSTREIARHIGCDHVTVANWLTRAPVIRSSSAHRRWIDT